jgi:twitching motility protein PilT
MTDIDELLRELVQRRGSDLHLKVGRPPLMRIAGDLLPTEYPPFDEAAMDRVLRKILRDELYRRLADTWEADAAYMIEGLARFRVNAFRQMDKYGAILRVIPLETPTIDTLGLPPVLKDVVSHPNGMVLVTGPTGSGKSTSLAAMINHVNETQPLHIVTIEDPVEFVYRDKMCTINQRQLGTDVKSLEEALRRVLRQDPDVILMGEMRDRETVEMATHAAETGHLVFSTLHTNDAKQTMDRIIDMFPVEAINQIRGILANTLRAVISQRLCRRADGSGRVAAMEIMINSPNIRQMIQEGKMAALDKEIAKSRSFYRMQTFNQSLAQLIQDNVVTEEEGLSTSSNPNDLRLALRGISGGADAVEQEAGVAAPAPAAKAEPAPEAAAAAAAPGQPMKIKIKRGF